MIERAVLLTVDDDVLDRRVRLRDAAGARRGRAGRPKRSAGDRDSRCPRLPQKRSPCDQALSDVDPPVSTTAERYDRGTTCVEAGSPRCRPARHQTVIAKEGGAMRMKLVAAAAVAVAAAAGAPWASSSGTGYEPVLDPSDFTTTIDNPYFPLPVGRRWVYRGVKDGKSQVDRVTSHRPNQGRGRRDHGAGRHRRCDTQRQVAREDLRLVRAGQAGQRLVRRRRHGRVLGQRDARQVGLLGSGCPRRRAGSCHEGAPVTPDAYLQEVPAGEAEDTAWIVATSGSAKVPAGTLQEDPDHARGDTDPGRVYDRKVSRTRHRDDQRGGADRRTRSTRSS